MTKECGKEILPHNKTFVISTRHRFLFTYKVVEISVHNGIVLGSVHRQSSTGVGYHRYSGSPKGSQDNGDNSLELGADNVARKHGAEVHQDDEAGDGEGERRAKDGPSSVGVGVRLGIFLRQ